MLLQDFSFCFEDLSGSGIDVDPVTKSRRLQNVCRQFIMTVVTIITEQPTVRRDFKISAFSRKHKRNSTPRNCRLLAKRVSNVREAQFSFLFL